MPQTYATAQVEALAPDPKSLKAGRGLMKASKWPRRGVSDDTLWGECQGSGKSPYQIAVDLGEPAFKCSCPSRKFPCKHGLALLLSWAEQRSDFVEGPAPDWAKAWQSARRQRAQQRAAKAGTSGAVSADPAAKNKRDAQRRRRMTEGVEEHKLWLRDLVAAGLAQAPTQEAGYWKTAAARLVDAQAPGLAARVGAMRDAVFSGENWAPRLLDRLGTTALLLEAFEKIDQQPPPFQADIWTMLGRPQDKNEVISEGERQRDAWFVLGQTLEKRDQILEQRIWLQGHESGRFALILHFAAANQSLDVGFQPGWTVPAELVFYPSATPLRALVVTREANQKRSPRPGEPDWQTAFAAVGAVQAENPWRDVFPVLLEHARLVPSSADGAPATCRDQTGAEVELHPSFANLWDGLALSGGAPTPLFGEWQPHRGFLPLAGYFDQQWIPFSGGDA